MAGITPTYGLRYPELVDPPDGAALGKNLADDVEAELVRVDASLADAQATAAGDVAACTLPAGVSGTVTATRRGAVSVVQISATADAGVATFGVFATVPAGFFDPAAGANGVAWNNNAGTTFGVYVDPADGTLRTRTAIGVGHLILGTLVIPLVPA